MSEGSIAITGEAAYECVRALAAGLPVEMRARWLAESLPLEVRKAAYKELLFEVGLLTEEEAGALVHWTGSGFARRATEENCPTVKMGHKQAPLYRFRDVDEMLARLRFWPKGKPAVLNFPAAGEMKGAA
jgi:hypothetical protein